MTTIAVVGLGYWGPNLARNFASQPGADLRWLCDGRHEVLERVAAAYPGVGTTSELDELLADPGLDAVVLATPVPSHAPLAVRVLEAGKHCFVEKPLAPSVADPERAVDAGRSSGEGLIVDHLRENPPGLPQRHEIADS